MSEIGIRTQSTDVVSRFLDSGGTLFDAQADSREVLTHAGADNLVVSVQIGVHPERPFGQRVDCSRRSLTIQLDEVLTRLGVDAVDLVTVGHFDPRTPPAEVADTVRWAIDSGRARYGGVRGYRGWQVAVTPGIVSAHHEYSLLRRGAEEELLPACEHLGVGVIAEHPLAHGVLAGSEAKPEARPYQGQATRTIVDALRTAADGLGASPTQAALAWALRRVDAVVVDCDAPEELADVLGARRLPESIDKALDDVSRVG